MNNSLKILEEAIKNKQPIVINWGQDELSKDKKDIKELSFWSDKENTFVSETGIWDLKLLYEIARGEVKNTSIEKVGDKGE